MRRRLARIDFLIELNEINHTTNIRVVQLLDFLDIRVRERQSLFNTNIFDEIVDLLLRKLVEPNTNKLLLEGYVDFTNIITNEEKLDIGSTTL